MLDEFVAVTIKLFLLVCAICFFVLLYKIAEERIAEGKPRNVSFYLSYIYKIIFMVIVGGGFIFFSYGQAIALLYLIYEFIVGLIS